MRYMTSLGQCYNRPVLSGSETNLGRRGERGKFPCASPLRGRGSDPLPGTEPKSRNELCCRRNTDGHDSNNYPIERVASQAVFYGLDCGPVVRLRLPYTSC